jgi:hypothetical protein
MATTRNRATESRTVGFIDHAKDSEIPGREVALKRLAGELVSAFFVAMALMWVVTAIAGVFS